MSDPASYYRLIGGSWDGTYLNVDPDMHQFIAYKKLAAPTPLEIQRACERPHEVPVVTDVERYLRRDVRIVGCTEPHHALILETLTPDEVIEKLLQGYTRERSN